MSLSESLRSVRQANTQSIHHETLFGLTDRSYKALAVKLGLKYHQWFLTTHLLQSALLSLAKSFREPNIYLHLISKWNHNLDAICECIWKAKADRLGSIIGNTPTILFTHLGLRCRKLPGAKETGNQSDGFGGCMFSSLIPIVSPDIWFSNVHQTHKLIFLHVATQTCWSFSHNPLQQKPVSPAKARVEGSCSEG